MKVQKREGQGGMDLTVGDWVVGKNELLRISRKFWSVSLLTRSETLWYRTVSIETPL